MDKIKNFLEPKTIAVIGASEEEGKVGYSLMKNLDKFTGEIIPVNIRHNSIFGKQAYKSVLDYPKKIDLAVIAIPSKSSLQVIEECGKKEIKSVIVITSGFSETGNSRDEYELVKKSEKYGIRILGPNCFGVCNPYLNLDTTFAMETPEKGDIAFISQSGALWSYISDHSFKRFGFSGFASLGNMSDANFSDFIEYFSKDERTKSIVIYMEKLKDGKRFIETCKRCKKPIYAIKSGKSKKGSEAAVSHTGSLATDYEIYKGAFKQAGIILCGSLEECFEKASGKKFNGRKDIHLGKRTIIITNAGGAGALITDYCESNGTEVAEWGGKNPWDLLGTATSADYKKALDRIKDKNFYDSVIVVLTPQKMSDIENTAEVVSAFKRDTNKNIIALFLGEKNMKEADEIFRKNKVQYSNNLLS